nr:hypothetical protein [Mycoplasmopsis bovis]
MVELRQGTQSADIKRAHLLRISPFANRIAFVQVKGSVLLSNEMCFPKVFSAGSCVHTLNNVSAK